MKRVYTRHPKGKRCKQCSKDMTGMNMYGRRIFCSNPCALVTKPHTWEQSVAAFWAKVDKGPHPQGCWIWIGGRKPMGYGHLRIKDKDYNAHRLAYELVVGPVPADKEVLHSCDNQPCVNPAHLAIGTHADNMHDMIRKGRNPRHRLNADQVREIRAALKTPYWGIGRDLAEKYDVTRSVISELNTGTTYGWIE